MLKTTIVTTALVVTAIAAEAKEYLCEGIPYPISEELIKEKAHEYMVGDHTVFFTANDDRSHIYILDYENSQLIYMDLNGADHVYPCEEN